MKGRVKAGVIFKCKIAVIELHSIATEFMNKAFRLKMNEAARDILYLNLV